MLDYLWAKQVVLVVKVHSDYTNMNQLKRFYTSRIINVGNPYWEKLFDKIIFILKKRYHEMFIFLFKQNFMSKKID